MNEFIVTINGIKHRLETCAGKNIFLDGVEHESELSRINEHSYVLRLGSNVYEVTSTRINDEKFGFLIAGFYFETTVRSTLRESAAELMKQKAKSNHRNDVRSPMPGLILKIRKQQGEQVEIGEPLLVLEAMKMENEIKSPASGFIKEIKIKEGDAVEKDALILTIE